MKIQHVIYFAAGAVLTSAGVGWWRADALRTTVLTG